MDGKGRKQADGTGSSCRREGSMSQGKTEGLVGREMGGGQRAQERGSPRDKQSEENAFRALL